MTAKRFQIVALAPAPGSKWAFIAHGARYTEEEAAPMIESLTGRGAKVRKLPVTEEPPEQPKADDPRWLPLSRQLRDEGYVHAHSARFAKTKERGRGKTWATIVVDGNDYRIEYG